jgi:nucleoside phosphorylase
MVLAELLARKEPYFGDKGPEVEQAGIGMMWHDLKGKVHLLSQNPDEARDILAASFFATEGTGGQRMSPSVQNGARGKRSVDILVICPLAKELTAALISFGLQPDTEEDDNIEGHKIFYVAENKKGKIKSVQIALSVVNRQRNVATALMTDRLLSEFAPRAAFLCGIGGGVKGKVELGDVVLSTGVIDRAGGRAEPDQVKPRSDPLPPISPLDIQLDYFAPTEEAWTGEIVELEHRLRNANRFRVPEPEMLVGRKFNLRPGIIVVGEQLIADGSLPGLQSAVDDRIRSCDMEGVGFARACTDRDVPWLIFRGISDFGDPNKVECEPWHATAAAASALAVRQFIQSELRFRSEVRSLRIVNT